MAQTFTASFKLQVLTFYLAIHRRNPEFSKGTINRGPHTLSATAIRHVSLA
jgi:hypothetical protein